MAMGLVERGFGISRVRVKSFVTLSDFARLARSMDWRLALGSFWFWGLV